MERVLVFSSMPSVITEEISVLESAWQYAVRGHEVVYLRCPAALLTCPANPALDPQRCTACMHQSAHTAEALLPPGTSVRELPGFRDRWDPPEFRTFADVASFEVDGVRLGPYLIGTLLDETRDLRPRFTSAESERLGVLARNSRHLFRAAARLIEAEGITTVVVRNPRRDSDGPVIAAARSLGRETAVVFPARTTEDLRVGLFAGVDFLTSPEIMRRRLESIRARGQSEAIAANAAEYFERLLTGRAPEGMKAAWFFPTTGPWQPPPRRPGRRLVAVFPSSAWEQVANRMMDSGATDLDDVVPQYRWLRELLSDAELRRDADVVVRWHPNLATAGAGERSMLDSIVTSSPPGVMHIRPEDGASSRDVIAASDAVITFGSTIAADATWIGRPTIQIGRSGLEHAGCVHVAEDVTAALRLLSSGIEARPRSASALLAHVLQSLDLPAPEHLERSAGGWVIREGQRSVKPPTRAASPFRSALRRLRSRLSGA